MFMSYIPSDIVVRRVNYVGGGRMADGHYAVADRADTGLIYVLHGSARYVTGDGAFDVAADHLFCLAKRARYEYNVWDGYDVRYVNFDVTEPTDLFGCGVALRDAKRDCAEAFRRLHTLYAHREVTMPLACRVVLDQLLQTLVRAQQTQYAPSDRYRVVQAAMAYMDRHFADPALRMEKVAAEVGVSDGQLRRLFRALYRRSPGQYLHGLRTDHAQQLLTETELPVGEIALRCGYTSLYYFSDAFRRATGAAPTDYRHAVRAERVGFPQ